MSTAERWGSLTILGGYRDRQQRRTYFIALCECGQLASVLRDNVRRGKTTSCGDQRRHPRTRTSGTPRTYGGVHTALHKLHGSASRLQCADCPRQADEWSYQHGCAAEVEQQIRDPRRKRGFVRVTYCPAHLSCYTPRCKGCHNVYDAMREAR